MCEVCFSKLRAPNGTSADTPVRRCQLVLTSKKNENQVDSTDGVWSGGGREQSRIENLVPTAV